MAPYTHRSSAQNLTPRAITHSSSHHFLHRSDPFAFYTHQPKTESMESDDDFDSFLPPTSPSSPQLHHRRLKRLKKASQPPAIESPEKYPNSIEDLLPFPSVNFAKLEHLEDSEENLLPSKMIDSEASKTLEDSSGEKSEENLLASKIIDSDTADVDSGLSEEGDHVMNKDLGFEDKEKHVSLFEENRKETKRALEFDDEVIEAENVDLEVKKPDNKRRSEINTDEENEGKRKEKKKKKRSKSDDDGEPKAPAVNKRKEEKDRKAYVKLLHAESQRVLRETRDASFKPIPVVHKPISSVLEKIRQRKLEVSKKTTMLINGYVYEKTSALQELLMDLDSDDVEIEEIEVEKSSKTVEDKTVECGMESSLGASSIEVSKETISHTSDGKVLTQMVSKEEPMPAFRAPADDTQDIFGDSQESGGKDEGDQLLSPPEEAFIPSILAMKLKFDSALPDDSSSEEEDNNKENIDPHLEGDLNGCASPKGDPVKAFVDEEAEEEEDSDDDIGFFKENEDEDLDDSEELNDMIATEYEERPIDNEKRNELHQKWLEQQDATGTDNLLHRLKYNSKYTGMALLDEDRTNSEDEEEFDDEPENEVPRNTSRMTSKIAKQMIAQMFIDKDDAFLSDEEEETEKRLMKQRLLIRSEKHAKLVLPAEDESSREVFGRIKKLNIAPDNKKEPKATSFFDTMLRGNNKNSSKSSFLGRVSNHPLPSSHKHGAIRSFVFGLDDSNSRSSISVSEDSSDSASEDNRSSKSTSAKFTYSQTRSCSQRSSSASAGETTAGSSLFQILKRSSGQTSFCNKNKIVDLSPNLFNAFKIPKKPVKIEGRS